MKVGNTECKNISILIPHNQIQCYIIPGTGGPYILNVTVGGQSVSSSSLFSYLGIKFYFILFLFVFYLFILFVVCCK